MNDESCRITVPGTPPSPLQVEEWIGPDAYAFWKRISQLIEQRYPNVFSPEWLFGGKKHGWSLRYKKGKSFCTLIPEKNRFALLIIFGAEERAKVETMRQELSARTRKAYDEATTYHDGKWVLLIVDADAIVADVTRLLALKRRPKNVENPALRAPRSESSVTLIADKRYEPRFFSPYG
ncbi:MAG: DUF3788 domain-containing protein [Deltaproteobacteria bacterium]|nr:DUF3788 domain-containing protein [Deltaproteobacteria bacterium]